MRKLSVCFCLLIALTIMVSAMGNRPKEEPKYKLEILKMEVVPAATVTMTGKSALLVIAPKDFQDQEYAVTRKMLEAKGIKVTVASATTRTATGMSGLKVKPDLAISSARAADYDAVVFIGGNGALVYENDPQAMSLAIEANKNNKVIGAICVSPMILAKAGLLQGKKATVSPYGTSALKKGGAVCTGKAVEVDGRIITGQGPAASAEFGQAVIDALQKD